MTEPDPEPIPEQPIRLAHCHWCAWQGYPLTEVEIVETGGGERRRCVDRDACRERVDAKIRSRVR